MARILDFLGQLADELCTTDDDDDGDGLLIHVVPTDDGANVGFLNLEGEAPAEVLLGTVAPDEWVALGVAARGGPGPSTRPPAGSRHRRRPGLAPALLVGGARAPFRARW